MADVLQLRDTMHCGRSISFVITRYHPVRPHKKLAVEMVSVYVVLSRSDARSIKDRQNPVSLHIARLHTMSALRVCSMKWFAGCTARADWDAYVAGCILLRQCLGHGR
jgi:hypothetical protein